VHTVHVEFYFKTLLLALKINTPTSTCRIIPHGITDLESLQGAHLHVTYYYWSFIKIYPSSSFLCL